jgi:hypothetical protein
VRFKEHKYAFETNSHKSNYAKHTFEQSHSLGSIEENMQVLQHQHKGSHLNTIEKFYVYAEFTKNNHLNDEHTISPTEFFRCPAKNPTGITKNTPTPPKPHTKSPATINPSLQ